jgi:TrmH family RNA methyltransferase
MANTGLDRLILVEPAVEIDVVARARAVGGVSILDSALRCSSLEEAIAPFRIVVGTSSQRDRVVQNRTITPRQLPERARGVDPADIALVFGPERSGLTTEELAPCALVVCIPTAPEKPTLNLAQAVLIVAYEFFLAHRTADDNPQVTSSAEPATAAAIGGLLAHADSILQKVGFARDSTYEGAFLDLKRLATRTALSDREVAILRGMCRKLERALGERGTTR